MKSLKEAKTDDKLWRYFKKNLGWGQDQQSKNIYKFMIKAKNMLSTDSIVIDIGAGQCRYKPFFDTANYIAIDIAKGDATWDYSKLDIFADITKLPIANETADVVICATTLEHICEPQLAINESFRVLKKDGYLFLYVPFVISEHQTPFDFFRYTRYGLGHLFKKAGYKIECIMPSTGSLYSGISLAASSLNSLPNSLPIVAIKYILKIVFKYLFVPLFNLIDRYDNKKECPASYMCICKKANGEAGINIKGLEKNVLLEKIIVCPYCKNKMEFYYFDKRIYCAECNMNYKYVNNVPSFVQDN